MGAYHLTDTTSMPPVLALAMRRAAWLLPTLAGLLFLTFFIAHVIPADPAGVVAGDTATPQQVAKLRHDLGLDRPLTEQFILYAGQVLHGDLGTSLYTRRPITEDLASRLPATLSLTAAALAIAIIGGVPLGVLAGSRPRGVLDHLIRALTVACFALPGFWLALLLQLLFAMQLRWLPLAGLPDQGSVADVVSHVTLPAITLGLPILATLVRFARAGMLEALTSPSVRYQRAMGLPTRLIVWRYGLRHTLVAVVAQAGLAFGATLAGSVVVETIFAWPGVGKYAYDSIVHADYPAVMGFVLWSGVAFVLINFVTDVLLALIDPRERSA